jgi:release factor glutamine methyltransferase
LNAERLLAHVLKFKRIELYLNFDRPLKEPELETFRALVRRRLKNEPLQYIIGETEFLSLPFQVDSRVLIPRPETEILVQTVIEKCQKIYDNQNKIKILDIGTGSGNIAISLAKNLPNAVLFAIDISAEALKLAQSNAKLNQVETLIQFIHGDITNFHFSESFEVIVSNPPYVTQNKYASLPLEIRNFEPKMALEAGVDGLACYRKIINQLPLVLNPAGFLALEVGDKQAQSVRTLLNQNHYSRIETLLDLNQIERVVVASKG